MLFIEKDVDLYPRLSSDKLTEAGAREFLSFARNENQISYRRLTTKIIDRNPVKDYKSRLKAGAC
jgi:hypothetical protein